MVSRVAIGLLAGAAALAAAFSAPGPGAASAMRVHAVSIDPADHLSAQPDASAFARSITSRLAANGVDTLYVNAYNVEYGAYYRTAYRFNTESDYGRQDLLGKLISAAHARGIRVVAAFYDHQHRGAWEARARWRAKTAGGGDYNPPVTDIQYYLSTGHPDAARWWLGFLRDVIRRYPDLDGIELREPIVNWWGTEADHNPAVTRAFRARHPLATVGDATWRRFRQLTLTRFLRREIALIHRAGLFAHVTTVATTGPSGALMPASYVARETGFDLDLLLGGQDVPDAVKVELIWQQWARLYGRVAFTPEWTRQAALAFLRQVRGRAPVVVHVELTDFGRSVITPEEFLRTLRAADIAKVSGVDFYSASLAESKHAWPAVDEVYGAGAGTARIEGIPHDRRALVLFDRGTTADRPRLPLTRVHRIALLNLLDHFTVKWETKPVDLYRRGGLLGYDVVVYLGSLYGNAPQAFLSDLSVYRGRILWIGQNLFQLAGSGVATPFSQVSQTAATGFTRISYRGRLIWAKGEAIPTVPRRGARVVATLRGPRGTTPFVLRAGSLWYVSGSPFSFVEERGRLNGRMLVFADVLHDVIGSPHRTARRALVRIADVDPLTDPARLRAVTGRLADRHVPFVVAVTPFHVDRQQRVSLSERPELAEALRDAVGRGGAIVLDGSEHRYRGVTGRDAEFWDVRNGGGVPEDGAVFVRSRIARALREMWANDLHPVAWETPQYLATTFDYSVFAETFSTFLERRTYTTWAGDAYQQPLPFLVEADLFGGRIVPENLGAIGQRGSTQNALANARGLLAVRDAIAGASVSVASDPGTARALADRLRALGYRFLDLYEIPNVVSTAGRVELTGAGSASLPVPSGWLLEQRIIARDGTVTSRRLDPYRSYARPTRSFPALPTGSLVSLRTLDPHRPLPPAPISPGRGATLVEVLAFLGSAGAVLLFAVYLVVRRGARRARPS